MDTFDQLMSAASQGKKQAGDVARGRLSMLYEAMPQERAGLLGNLAGRGFGRSTLFGGMGSQQARLQTLQQGNQVGDILSSATGQQQNLDTLMRQARYNKMLQQPGVLDYLSIPISVGKAAVSGGLL